MHLFPRSPATAAFFPGSKEWIGVLAFFLAHTGTCGFAQWLAIVPGTGISLWIPGGLYLAALLLTRIGLWPAVMAAAAGAELLANAVWFNNPVPVALTLHLGNALASVTGALIVRAGALQRRFRLVTLRDVMLLLVAGAGIAPMLSAMVGAVTLHYTEGQDLRQAWLLWWLGDAAGVLIGAPLALIAAHECRSPTRPAPRRLLEAAALCALLLTVSVVSLGGSLPFAYVVTPVLVWAAVSFQFPGAAFAILLLTLMTAYFTVSGSSPFAGTAATQALHSGMLKLFLAVSSILALCVAAVSRQYLDALTALHQANAELEDRVQQRTRQLQDAARHKDVLLATIAHELRTPLSAIMNGSLLLKSASRQPELLPQVQQVVERQVRVLTRLVDDLTDAAAISEGKLALDLGLVNLADVARQSVEACRPRLHQRQHRLQVAIPDGPIWVRGDSGRLVQCVCNLLDNAVKYTEAGGHIGLELSVRAGSLGQEAKLQVTDDGHGIPAEQQQRVFEMFYRAYAPTVGAAVQHGLGLGLALVRRLVQLQGGEVGVYSDGLGRGSTFWLTLPLATLAEGDQVALPDV